MEETRKKLFFYTSYLCNYSYFYCSLLIIAAECACRKQKSDSLAFVLLIKFSVAEFTNQNGKIYRNYCELKISIFMKGDLRTPGRDYSVTNFHLSSLKNKKYIIYLRSYCLNSILASVFLKHKCNLKHEVLGDEIFHVFFSVLEMDCFGI